ncbi:MAG TPA: toll/interleukin-1 receptor domain-containing protein [Thermoanaerobaculia bacterium]
MRHGRSDSANLTFSVMTDSTEVNSMKLRAFICHASEDKDLARRIAEDLHKAGIDTFLDEWEIRAGDSLRRKIDEGLSNCTHFVLLLTETSLLKPWVNAEIDAAFVQRIQRSAVLIPVRYRLEANRLPPLLAPLLSPELRSYEADIRRVIDDIRGVSRKPPVTPFEALPSPSWSLSLRLSPLAASIAEMFAQRSVKGRNDPQLDIFIVREITGASNDDLIDAIGELKDLGWVKPHGVIGAAPFGYRIVTPTEHLFAHVDPYVMNWSVEQDAVRVAAEVANAPNRGLRSAEIASRLSWTPRRLNPTLSFLIGRRLVLASENIDATFVSSYLMSNDRTRRFVRDNS